MKDSLKKQWDCVAESIDAAVKAVDGLQAWGIRVNKQLAPYLVDGQQNRLEVLAAELRIIEMKLYHLMDEEDES